MHRHKRAFDILGASVLLLLTAPLMLLTALVVRASDGGPALIGHVRIGCGGRPFRCLKFRSMVVDAEAVLQRLLATNPSARQQWMRSRKLSDDPRVTRIGRLLRVTSLDELPQLLNVLRGDMSLVGPRPVVMEELVEHYGPIASAHYLSVRPGIAGLWQASGRSNTTYAERVSLDAAYVRDMSLTKDLAILCRTAIAVLTRCGAR